MEVIAAVEGMGGWYVYLAVSGLVCFGLAHGYNLFIEGRFHPFGWRWDNDTAVDLSVVIGVGLLMASVWLAYVVYGGAMTAVQLIWVMTGYCVAWGLPMIIGFRRRLRYSQKLFDENMQTARESMKMAEFRVMVTKYPDVARRVLEAVSEGE